MENQFTIKKSVSIEGSGLHTGEKVKIEFKPAPADSGVSFVRVDLPGSPVIRATTENIIDLTRSPRRTSIGNNGAEIHTIEHLMAVLSGIGIDNIYININGAEVPGLDGSGKKFFEILKEAGLLKQNATRKVFAVKEPIWLEDQDAMIAVMPSSQFRISYTLSYEHPMLEAEYLNIVINQDVFEKEITPARTFCLESEVKDLQKQGLGKGANYDNTLVIGKNDVIKNRLRFKNEFTRHKILDLIGDLYLLGVPMKAHIIAVKSGHPLNIRLLRKVQQQKQRYELAGVGSGGYRPVTGEQMDVTTIMKILPHREPFLFVDKIIDLEIGKRIVGVKNLTINDYFFKGHFPGKPVMPGVLIVEAMAQVGGVLMLAAEEHRGKLAFFLAADKVKFRKTVVPGDQLILEVNVGKIKSKTGQVFAKAFVEGKLVAQADLMFALVEG